MSIEFENHAQICRVTCGWKRPELDLRNVRPYWRDAHSPAIARRAGIYEYRHYPLDPVRDDLFEHHPNVDFSGEPDQFLMWLSDVRYADQEGLDAFTADPGPDEKAAILGDIELIVDKSTTYLVLGENGKTLLDKTGNPAPAGPVAFPTYQVFFRQRGTTADFQAAIRALASQWSNISGVRRTRLSLFEVPDMEAERKAGYPVKTHPIELQYQAWIDLVIDDDEIARGLVQVGDVDSFSAVHAYPTPEAYTFNYRGRPTTIGLRGYAALSAIRTLGADHQASPKLLSWMYGDVTQGGPFA